MMTGMNRASVNAVKVACMAVSKDGSKALAARKVDRVAMGRASDEEMGWVYRVCVKKGIEADFFAISG